MRDGTAPIGAISQLGRLTIEPATPGVLALTGWELAPDGSPPPLASPNTAQCAGIDLGAIQRRERPT